MNTYRTIAVFWLHAEISLWPQLTDSNTAALFGVLFQNEHLSDEHARCFAAVLQHTQGANKLMQALYV